VSEPLKLRIHTHARGEPAGYDSSIITVPADWYATADGTKALLVKAVGAFLRELSERQAADLGETLHHADWVITSDPAEVRTRGLAHGCPSCHAGVDEALVYLRASPGNEVAVGLLFWADPDA
jgi:hypothetical protein